MAIGPLVSELVVARDSERWGGWAGPSLDEMAVKADPSHPAPADHLLRWAVHTETSGTPALVV